MLFCIYCHLCMCFFVTLLAGGNKEVYLCIINIVVIVLNVRDGTESKYPSIIFLSIDKQLCLYY